MNSTTAQATITINASVNTVWQALTDPQLVKQYMFGSTLVTDWKIGEPVLYRGEWEGKSYEDKGMLLAFEPMRTIAMTFFSPASGLEDKPENYQKITYDVVPEGESVQLTVTQENNKDEASASRSQENWQMILGEIKKLVEATA